MAAIHCWISINKYKIKILTSLCDEPFKTKQKTLNSILSTGIFSTYRTLRVTSKPRTAVIVSVRPSQWSSIAWSPLTPSTRRLWKGRPLNVVWRRWSSIKVSQRTRIVRLLSKIRLVICVNLM